jgi:hypothetical protein
VGYAGAPEQDRGVEDVGADHAPWLEPVEEDEHQPHKRARSDRREPEDEAQHEADDHGAGLAHPAPQGGRRALPGHYVRQEQRPVDGRHRGEDERGGDGAEEIRIELLAVRGVEAVESDHPGD